MSILIKGIEMPKVCADCPFRGVRYESGYYQYEKCKVLDKIFNECRLDINPYEEKLDDCPLIEVDNELMSKFAEVYLEREAEDGNIHT